MEFIVGERWRLDVSQDVVEIIEITEKGVYHFAYANGKVGKKTRKWLAKNVVEKVEVNKTLEELGLNHRAMERTASQLVDVVSPRHAGAGVSQGGVADAVERAMHEQQERQAQRDAKDAGGVLAQTKALDADIERPHRTAHGHTAKTHACASCLTLPSFLQNVRNREPPEAAGRRG